MLDGVPDDLEQTRLGMLAELVALVDVEHDLDVTACADSAAERVESGREPEVAKRSRLEILAQGTQVLTERTLAAGREDEDGGVRRLREDLLRRLEPVHVRHAEIHEHHVGTPPLGQADCGPAVGRLADHADAGRAGER